MLPAESCVSKGFAGPLLIFNLCKWSGKSLGSTFTLKGARKRSKRWLGQWALATARLKSLWASSPHPKSSWRRNWRPGPAVSPDLLVQAVFYVQFLLDFYWSEKPMMLTINTKKSEIFRDLNLWVSVFNYLLAEEQRDGPRWILTDWQYNKINIPSYFSTLRHVYNRWIYIQHLLDGGKVVIDQPLFCVYQEIMPADASFYWNI